MKKIFSFIFLFLIINSLVAQEDETSKPISKESEAYHSYRLYTATPPYGLQKVNGLIAKIAADSEENEKLSNKKYLSMSLREKFTYNMINAEDYSQNCDMMPEIQNEQKKIFAQLPDAFGEYDWSDRQEKFFKENRDSVIELMNASILRTKRVGLNYKDVIVMINATSMIPLLIKTYNRDKKDHDILTVLMLLMKKNDYAEFINSSSFKKLYVDDESSYRVYLSLNSANEELIIKRASDFYNGLSK
jgi:hypothetical protein